MFDVTAGSVAQQHLQRGRVALELGRFELARREAHAAASTTPHSPEPFLLAGQAALGLHRPNDALDAANAALVLKPDAESAHMIRALALLDKDLPNDALEAAEEAVRLAPRSALTHDVRARALAAAGRGFDAIEAAEHAQGLEPENDTCLTHLAGLLLSTDPKRAEEIYLQILQRTPDNAVVLNNLGVALQRQGRKRDAIRAFKAAVQADPTLALAKRNTHAAVRRWTTVSAGVGMGGLLAATKMGAFWKFIFALNVLRATSNGRLGLLLGCIAVGVVIVWITRKAMSQWRMRKLRREDPELFAMFSRIEGDRREGRL